VSLPTTHRYGHWRLLAKVDNPGEFPLGLIKRKWLEFAPSVTDDSPLIVEIFGRRYCDFHMLDWIGFSVAILTNFELYCSRSVKLHIDSFRAEA
jgi:hypothetical protein